MTDPKVGALKKTLAAICSRCPICNHARAHPDSWLGRALHHAYNLWDFAWYQEQPKYLP